jgi:hypothetical protein
MAAESDDDFSDYSWGPPQVGNEGGVIVSVCVVNLLLWRAIAGAAESDVVAVTASIGCRRVRRASMFSDHPFLRTADGWPPDEPGHNERPVVRGRAMGDHSQCACCARRAIGAPARPRFSTMPWRRSMRYNVTRDTASASAVEVTFSPVRSNVSNNVARS